MPLVDPDRDGEVKERLMPVDAEGRANGATVVVYDSGLAQLIAYYARCCFCAERHPFFSPSDRDAWAEVHRADTGHAMELTVEPWDFRTPPWVAADGLPLTPPRSLA
ncbi:hypothetical protein AB0M39_35100 [Streptomyces sp. NPDC051907]|uniref:hypothetical protein n=1 Tax=Streptomyces sp. NPDC051907 TaxID=3155284 RepID=UPI00342C25D9